MRTGFSDAWATDDEDDSYDLSWCDELPDDDLQAIKALRRLLATEPDPLDRHFQFAELECRLYRCRDVFDSALDEYDAACRAHDAEMERICQAFRAKWGLYGDDAAREDAVEDLRERRARARGKLGVA